MTQPSQGDYLDVSNVADAIPTRPFGACAFNRLTSALRMPICSITPVRYDNSRRRLQRRRSSRIPLRYSSHIPSSCSPSVGIGQDWDVYEAARQASHHPGYAYAYACTSLAAGSVLSLLVAHGVSVVGGIAVSSKR